MRMRTHAIAGHDIERLPQAAEKWRATSGRVSLIIAYFTVTVDATWLRQVLGEAFGDTPILGASTCRGIVCDHGIFGFGEPAVGLLMIQDDAGAYGACVSALGANDGPAAIAEATVRAIDTAQEAADRPGEAPAAVVLHTSPGIEELVIDTLRTELGRDILITGGSCGDEAIEGAWQLFDASDNAQSGVGLGLLYCDGPVTHRFQNGYQPTGISGRVTRADGRRLIELDNQPAADVYNRWTDGLIDTALRDRTGNILDLSAWSPLGKQVGVVPTADHGSVETFCLIHPAVVGGAGEISLFADVTEGETLHLMKGSPDQLIARPAEVASTTLAYSAALNAEAKGALMTFCAGCMLALGDDIKTAQARLAEAYAPLPYMVAFTFGEQGSMLNGDRLHGNLMISSTVFST